jgi:hypothetical protein
VCVIDKVGNDTDAVDSAVLGLKGINVPIPQTTTMITCTLNNGIHFVTTPECRFGKDCRVEQEFELYDHIL